MSDLRVQGYEPGPGVHADTAAISRVLSFAGYRLVASSDGDAEAEEAMVLGIGGGLGAGYILWEFKKASAAIPVFGFRNNWQYPVKFVEALKDRLGLSISLHETGGAKGAQKALEDCLADGRPAIVWVEPFALGYLQIPDMFKGCFGHVVTVVGFDAEAHRALVADRSASVFEISAAALAAARKGISSYKHRLLTIAPSSQADVESADLERAVHAGLTDCAEHLARPSDSFSLPVIRKWSRMTTDRRNKKGWPTVFAGGKGLLGMLAGIYENVQPLGLHGGNLRGLYARFLDQAAAITGLALSDPAERYRALDEAWRSLALAAMPDTVEALAATRGLIDQQARVRAEEGGAGLDELVRIRQQLDDQAAAAESGLGPSEAAMEELFADLGERLSAIYEAEVEANRSLASAISG